MVLSGRPVYGRSCKRVKLVRYEFTIRDKEKATKRGWRLWAVYKPLSRMNNGRAGR